MKVLSLKEPFASLIKESIKKIETRSWKTKYRGELYIHASLAKVDTKDKRINELIELLKGKNFKYGYIIAKCNLVDCIYMDQEFIDKAKKDDIEFKCGRYGIGRYAWILDNVEILDNPIKAKGQLSIWNYNK
jgi:hypothetical protein